MRARDITPEKTEGIIEMKNTIDHKTLHKLRKALRRGNSEYEPGVFVELPRHKWPTRSQSIPLSKVLRSRDFLVQVFEGEFTRLSICRTELNKSGHWKDGITWDEMQSVKDGCGYADRDAVEAFPKKADITYMANMRHLWIVPEEYTQFFWREGRGSGFRSGKTAEELIGLPTIS